MRKKEQNEVWIMWLVKALLAAYVVTGILLIILALALYKFELNEGAVTAGVTAVYLISTFTGGLVVGKLAKSQAVPVGNCSGEYCIFALLCLSQSESTVHFMEAVQILVTFALCAEAAWPAE